jgi:nucleolar complex protein 2
VVVWLTQADAEAWAFSPHYSHWHVSARRSGQLRWTTPAEISSDFPKNFRAAFNPLAFQASPPLELPDMAQTKATKRFEKKHLNQTLKRRNEGKKFKQREQLKAKKRARRAKDNEGAVAAQEEKVSRGKVDTEALNSISVDDFFGGFEIPQKPKKKRDGPLKTAKRKRTPVEDVEEDDDSDLPDGMDDIAEPVASDSESEAGLASADDADAHKEQLASLSKQDPEFYKYLQENEPELLDFDEDADLAALDELSAEEDETIPRKKQKTGDAEGAEHEVTQAMVTKWATAMAEQYSLRSAREVVLAFRGAVYANEDDKKVYKYTVSEPEGLLCPKLKICQSQS